jgi:hypothetical protein
MLRSRPIASEALVLAIDIGTTNAGCCLFDRTSHTVLYWRIHKLLDRHAPSVQDTGEVKRHLDELTNALQPHLANRTYQVLVEDQVMKGRSDKDIAKKGLYFNIQLQSAVSMYFLCQGCKVQTIDSSERYRFLGIHKPSKLSRYHRKQAVVQKISRVLTEDAFARQPHDLTAWAASDKRDDLADALVMVLQACYRNLSNVYEKHGRTNHDHAEQQPARPTKRSKPTKQTHTTTAAALVGTREELQAKLQALGTYLDMTYHAVVKKQCGLANKIAAAYATRPKDRRLTQFLQLLHAYNQQGHNGSNAKQLEARLTGLV